MPDSIPWIDTQTSNRFTRINALSHAFFGNKDLNSTIGVAFAMEESQLPQTGLVVRAWDASQSLGTRNKGESLVYLRSVALVSPRKESTSITSTDNPEAALLPVSIQTASLPSAIASNWNDLAKGGLSEGIYQRLLELAILTAGWNGPGSLGMNASSLWSFVKTWKQIRKFCTEPELVLTPSGNIQAEWSKSRRHHLEMDFRASGENSYFALIDGTRAVIDGVASLKEILRIILSYRNGLALTWKYEQE
jgi:hypothetical protein